ncbi:MAG: GTPase [Sciscionella sp.]
MSAPAWLDILDATIAACGARHRADLAQELRHHRARLLDPRLRVAVLGERNHGKSELINALLNAPVCAAGDDVTTVEPTIVAHADAASAVLVTGDATTGRRALPAGSDDRVPVPIEAVTGRGNRRDVGPARGSVTAVEVGLPHTLLASGLVLIDTVAVEGSRPSGDTRAHAVFDAADAVVLACDATYELSPTGLRLAARATRGQPGVAVALTKIDLVPRWREVAERDRAKLAAEGVAATLLPVSATLRLHAARSGDSAGNAESGFPELIGWLAQQVAAKSRQSAAQAVATLATAAIVELATPLSEEINRAAERPEGSAEANQVAQQNLDDLRRGSARCHTALSDGMADLLADVEHDLRQRTRKILREIEHVFERADPASVWEQFAEWLTESLGSAAETNFSWFTERARWVAGRVAEEFPVRDEAISPESVLGLPEEADEGCGELERPHLERFGIGQVVFTGMRGSYGGVLMFGLMTSLAGMPLINPLSLGAGAAFAGKSIRDESESRLRRRQLAARTAAQRYIDDFFIQFNKYCKDIGRDVHRTLRDRVTELTEQAQDGILRSARAAADAAAAEAAQREAIARRARQELQQLVALHGRAQALASAP